MPDDLISFFYVHDKDRGKGHGKALMEHVLDDKKRAALYTGKFTVPRAVEMYKRRGFKQIEDFGPGKKKYWIRERQ